MAKYSKDKDLDALNACIHIGAREYHGLDCDIKYGLDDLEEMVTNNESKEDILKCIRNYKLITGGKILRGGRLNWRVFNLVKAFIPGLEEPDIELIKEELEAEYDGRMGVK